jgi:hypothetical protein
MNYFIGVDIGIPLEFISLFSSYFMNDICDLANDPLLILRL